MSEEKGNFKSRVFGGFDRRDVIQYIESLAKERNALALENQKLRGQVEALEDRVSELSSRRPEEPEDAAGAPECATPELPGQEELVSARVREVLDNAHGVLNDARSAYKQICGDININASQADHELRAVSAKLTALQESLRAAGERLEAMDAELEIMPLQGPEV